MASDPPSRRAGRPITLAAALLLAAAPAMPAASDETVAGPVAARLLAVIDGDTIAVRARIWLGQTVETRVRLAGVDAPELGGRCATERELAGRARDLVAQALDGGDLVLRDIGYDKYGGRVVARVESMAGVDLAALLIAAGLGRTYDGGARSTWCAAEKS